MEEEGWIRESSSPTPIAMCARFQPGLTGLAGPCAAGEHYHRRRRGAGTRYVHDGQANEADISASELISIVDVVMAGWARKGVLELTRLPHNDH